MKSIRSITEQVYVNLRADLIACRVRPGSKLRTVDLSKRFGVSLSAVREALTRLSADGLAIADPQRGFTAAPVSPTDLLALAAAHMGVETLCIQRALAVGDSMWEARLQAALDDLIAVPVETQHLSLEFASAYTAFESALVSACDNPWLMRLRATLSAQTERYKCICLPNASAEPDPMRMLRDICHAAIERDAQLTVSLVAKVRRLNTARFIKAMESSVEEIRPVAAAASPAMVS
jgi:GntR family transcriptional regulator, carbon starvation induced regulator